VPRAIFGTDDLSPGDLLHTGSVDHMVRLAIDAGVPPMLAIRMATLNPAEHFRLEDRGRIVPGCRCDLVVVDNPLDFRPFQVYQAGRLVAQGGQLTEERGDLREVKEPERLRRSVAVDWRQVDLTVPAEGERIRVIGLVPGAAAYRGGGGAAAAGEHVLCLLPLPIAGLMSDLGIEDVARQAAELAAAARKLGTPLRDPFMTLSFLALEVIPALKLTDRGLVDVQGMQLVPLFPAD
jgi:adenine deaminase